MINCVQIDPSDNVCVSIAELPPNTLLSPHVPLETSVSTTETIPQFHKIAIKEIPENTPVIKYGEYIGLATKTIHAGDWVHTHNMASSDAKKEVADGPF